MEPWHLGLMAAVVSAPDNFDWQQGGFAALLGFVVYWITNQLSKRIDDLNVEQKALRAAIEHLTIAIEKRE